MVYIQIRNDGKEELLLKDDGITSFIKDGKPFCLADMGDAFGCNRCRVPMRHTWRNHYRCPECGKTIHIAITYVWDTQKIKTTEKVLVFKDIEGIILDVKGAEPGKVDRIISFIKR